MLMQTQINQLFFMYIDLYTKMQQARQSSYSVSKHLRAVRGRGAFVYVS